MNIEQTKETPKITAKINEEQSVEEQPKDARIEQQKIEQNEGEEEEGIFVPNWLVEAMEWIKRMDMKESSLSTSCQAFEQLCLPKLHGKVKKHLVELLIFDKKKDQSGKYRAVVHRFEGPRGLGPEFPLPQEPPPEYILGFNNIEIRFLDNRIMEFFKLIAPKLNDIKFIMGRKIDGWDKEDEWTKAIQYLLNIFRNKISKLCFDYGGSIEHFNQLFPGIIDPNQIKELGINPDGSIKRRDFEIAIDWLMNGRQTDEQKIFYTLYIGIRDWDREHNIIVKQIKEAFLNDTTRRNFLVYLVIDRDVNEFRSENRKTGEILHFYQNANFQPKINNHRPRYWFIRCPKEEEDRWKKEGEKKMRDILDNVDNGTTTFDLYLDEFWALLKHKCADAID